MAKYGIKGIDSQKLKQYNGKKSIFWLEQREKRDFKEGGESMAATIADVANLAGCAITTVSRAFSVPEKVRPQTRERILQAAETLRYSPNAIARAMVYQRNHSLAFVVDPWQYPIMDAFYAEIAGAVQLEAEQRGYWVYTTASDRRELFMKKNGWTGSFWLDARTKDCCPTCADKASRPCRSMTDRSVTTCPRLRQTIIRTPVRRWST